MKYEKLRSLQHTRAPLKEIEQSLLNPVMKVGELALLALSSILQHPDFPEDVLENFLRFSYSKRVFGLSYPLLIRKREWSKAMPYYANYLCCKGKYYCLCSAWLESHRARLIAWVKKHKIDIDEKREGWSCDEASHKKRRTSTTLTKGPHNTINCKRQKVCNLSTIGKLFVDCGVAYADIQSTWLKEIKIAKRVFAPIARKNKKCAFQVKSEKQKTYIFIIEAQKLFDIFVRDFDDFSDGIHDLFWHFYLNVENAYLYSWREDSRFLFARCTVYEVEHLTT